jgi:hypothetical protein
VRFLVAATWLIAAAGCEFEHGQLDSDGSRSGETPDAGSNMGPGGSTTPDAPPQISQRSCAYAVAPDTRLCLEFNDGFLTPNARDASAAHLDPKTTSVHMTMRGTDPAVTVESGGSMTIAENPSLDIGSAITIEAWVRRSGPQAASIIFNQGQYLLGMDGAGFVYCNVAGTAFSADQAHGYLVDGAWHHIACTYDGSDVQAYLDGSSYDCRKAAYPSIPKNGNQGTLIAPNFTGDIDGVRIWARDLGPTNEICSHANKTSCQRSCNSGGTQSNDGGFHF